MLHPSTLKHVTGADIRWSLADRQLLFAHIPKAAGTTMDRILVDVAKHLRKRWMRIQGTVYGQYFGQGKPTVEATLETLNRESCAAADIVSGHLPTSLWDSFLEQDRAALVTILRDPVERLLSHYRFGISRGGWTDESSLLDLAKSGAVVDNQQVRQLSGCLDPAVTCDETMLRAALKILKERYVLSATSDSFDDFLAHLITLFGWPDIIYSNFQVGRTELDQKRLATLRQESADLNRMDLVLFDEVKCHEPVWVNLMGDGEPPWQNGTVLVVSPLVRPKDKDVIAFPKSQLQAFRDSLGQNGLSLS